ncbi:Chromosome segregation protein sudA [Fulvia fulva]|uniref:Structural maintenance of chromosomes protein n=1 Tax=Passalora fulva TaxID=5499 RepID=A0A9Q8LIA0_PASFU|nr:Chromosome segregation protein sudA [Fulvia fulva]KAK4624242.1 Chromosome segregation protein sudA [Fulvia fulva]KAK4625677.1 Chromosome segregation protein sudA [Fulvia fulva]UJO17649.1 Chromosome segregation protein sudA [Fulvia fulva]WPV14891.1 Chromosome segregation protein sudA [Fulvia fulva]WPV29594.1 Chromosome segregation protein sudA [Fulvia fulva]
MYIKQIIIQGFKSYKDQTVIEPFSPKHNVIVGRNGSGKSNFFAAVRFVLSDKYTQLSREDRQSLLHEGAGSAVMSAYVELIIDNSDERIPTNTPEVILRRTIGQKKDEYSLNRKNTTKNEVLNILESAGFSRSNPYYIVPQGRVTAITNMKDNERLNMLKTVAGTEVYESRRAESHKIMQETEQKRNKIDDLLEHIRTRLDELESEKEELRAFQDKERERKCLEYSIHKKDEESISEQLERIDEAVEGRTGQNDDHREAMQEAESQLETIDAQITSLQQQIKLLTQERAQYKDERKEAARTKAKAESDLQAAQDNQSAAQQAQAQQAEDLKDTQHQIKQHEAQLKKLLPEYNAKREEERTVKQQMQEAQATVQRLYAKQGRQNQFRTKKERDTWLQQRIAESNSSLAKTKANSIQISEDVTELEETINQLETDIAELRERIDNRGGDQQNIATEVQRAKDDRDRLQDQRKELWREEARLDSVIENARRQLNNAEHFLSHMMDQNTSRGLANIRKIVREEAIEGAYGPLGELFKCQPQYKTAAEVTAGVSLFHFVVNNDEIATKLIERLKRDKLGRVTFVPLSRINIRPTELPKASDAVPLLSRIKYEPTFESAMQQVFGRTIVCPNLHVASQYARSHSLSAITPSGDRSDKRGALTGGYYDDKQSRLDGIAKFVAARDEFENADGRKEEIRHELQQIDQKVTKAMSILQKSEQKRTQLEGGYGPLREELRSKERELSERRDEMDAKQRQKENVDALLSDFSNQLSGWQSELQADFKKALSNQEERQLDDLNAQLPELRKQHAQLSHELAELDGQKREVEDTLNVNLRPRLDQLQATDLDTSLSIGGSSSVRLKELKSDFKRATKALDNIETKLQEIEQSIEEQQKQLQDIEASRANKAAELEKLEQAIRNYQKNVEKNASRRAQYSARLTEVRAQINGLGVLPDVAFSVQYTNMSTNTATQRLHKVQESLKKYGHVNKKAFEQFKQFETQRTELENRRKELDASDSSIRELIDVLDQRKDEAIVRTFKQVSKEFSAVFEKLVPAGKGRLIIQRRSDKQANGAANLDDSDDEDQNRSSSGVENYIGVGISVSFNSKHDEQQRIQQLSGGQKSLCALALVFAIQFSDPAPFYLFDEIDANLDAQYRTAVAQLLQECSQTGQFICTTFRPEMLHVAEKCYGVSYLNKASSIDVVSREQALDFVDGQISGK